MEKQVISVIRRCLDTKKELNIGDELVNDLGIDSFDMLMIVNDLEVEFNVTIDEKDLIDVKTISDIIDGLKKRLNQ